MQDPERIMFFSKSGVVTRSQFNANLGASRERLAAASIVCNLHQDRYLFALGLVAAVLNNCTTVLPPSLAPEAIRASIADAPHPIILSRKPEMNVYGTRLSLETTGTPSVKNADYTMEVQNRLTEIRAFSSGSTSQPKCNVKTWEMLIGGAGVTNQILQCLSDDPSEIALLGTTPRGHMYGLEATILTALGYGYITYQDTIFYPADLEAAIEVARNCGFSKLVLVTSPAHLRFLEPVILEAPEIICILSATAPLPYPLAKRLTTRSNLKVMEIYGSTETGSVALRETVLEEAWTPSTGFSVCENAQSYLVSAPHLPAPVPIEDDLKLRPDGRFTLLGRTGDMVNVRGKSSRLSALNAILSEVPELSDGLFLHAKRNDADQLAIAVVQNPDAKLAEDDLRAAIRKHLFAASGCGVCAKKDVGS